MKTGFCISGPCRYLLTRARRCSYKTTLGPDYIHMAHGLFVREGGHYALPDEYTLM